MIKFTAFEYVLISIANAYGLDKLLFEDRIQWCKNQGKKLYQLTNGFLGSNTTPATSGNQQVSPAYVRTGQGWKTTSTAASQSVS